MKYSCKIVTHFLLSMALALSVLSCSGEITGGLSPELGSAETVLPLEARKIAIVHSQASKSNFYDPFAYNQLFAAMQHQAMMAGIPFDLLDEDQLATTADLLAYDTILIPMLSHVNRANRQRIIARLLEAQQNGIGIITSGEFLGSREDGTPFSAFSEGMVSVLGIQPVEYFSGVEASVTVADNSHPVTKSYQPDEELQSYEEIWFGRFEPVSGEQSTAITNIESAGSIYTGAQVIDRSGRVVHFANDQIMADNNLLWRVIQWVTYGDIAPVSLQVSRADHVFLARNDMDQAMIAAELIRTEIPLLNIIRDWKEDYNFVGSYYIDIGNDPSIGQYTDWAVSGPLYSNYIDLGNEIATHSWTHPHYTSLLTAEELEFEFKDSAAEIGSQLGVPVIGAAVPGNAESLEVVETLNPWLEYLSGRTGAIGSGYLGATGYLEPQHSMMYFSLNMSPDFTLIDYLNKTPSEATTIWKDELDGILKHAQQPLVHWLWHDYGPTTQTAAGLYTKEMFSDTIAYAHAKGGEFATAQDIHQRIKTFANVDLQVGSAGTVTANVNATGVGQFSLKVNEDKKIASVANWYAYSDNRLFLPDTGGEFSITLTSPDTEAASVTRITSLPMRSRLMSLTGNGNRLNFTFQGEGEVTIALSTPMTGNTSVSGADSFSENGNLLTLQFNSDDTHTVELTPVVPLNQAPVANNTNISAVSATASPLLLSATDSDGDTLSYTIESNPLHGTLSGTAPDLLYTSDTGYSGSDNISFTVSDGTTSSNLATVGITVTPAPSLNSPPIANKLLIESLLDQPLTFQLSGSDTENQPLTYQVTSAPANGVLSGTAPLLTYTPNAGFVGTDSLEFIVNDSIADSETGTVQFNVNSRIPPSTGTVSNEVTDFTNDGVLTEWASMTAFGTDPQDITGANNQIDWKSALMGHDASNFYIAYTEHGAANLTWGNQIYIDIDSDSTTGFRGFGSDFSLGADYLIEGNALFRYFEDAIVQNDWLWMYVTDLAANTTGDSAEITIPRSQLNNTESLQLFFYGNSAATAGTSLDYFPDNAGNPSAAIKSRRFSYSVNANNTPGNFAPIAFAQRIQMVEGTTYPLTLTGFDPDGDPLEYHVGTNLMEGTLSGTAPNLLYTPNAGATYDLITYDVTDGTTSSDSRSIQFFIVPAPTINNPPSANNATLETTPAGAIPVTLSGTDADDDTLSYRIVQQPATGTLAGSAPDLTYTASAATGTDSFTFVTNDGTADSTPATVTVIISEEEQINFIPQAESQSVTTNFETALGITLVATDAENDPLSYIIARQPALGSLSGVAPNLTYIPFANTTGTDSFIFFVNDGASSSANATVEIEIQPPVPVNTAPTATGQSLSTTTSQPLSIVLSGRDAEQTDLTYSVSTQPQGGVLSGSAPNLIYTPNADFSGADSFQFGVSDGELSSANATITINVGSSEGVVSNPVTSLTIDGSISDWNGLLSLGSDPADIYGVSANNPLDWREVWVAHSPSDLYIAYKNHKAFTLSWGHGIYIDIDNNTDTGFRGFSGEFPIGADILLEFNDIQQYTGTGNDWAWVSSGEAMVATSGEFGELSVPLIALSAASPTGATAPQSLRFYLRADNAAFAGNSVDHFPDAALDATADPESRSLHYSLVP